VNLATISVLGHSITSPLLQASSGQRAIGAQPDGQKSVMKTEGKVTNGRSGNARILAAERIANAARLHARLAKADMKVARKSFKLARKVARKARKNAKTAVKKLNGAGKKAR
jgi:hypothetical protein